MPRRNATGPSSATPAPAPTSAPPPPLPAHAPALPLDNLTLLRRQWKWAAFSQFYYTFARICALDDVQLTDIEDDLVHSTMNVLPRIIHKLLQSLTLDRKTQIDNWQIVLRRQYLKRDPASSPLGPEPQIRLTHTPEPRTQSPSAAPSDAVGVAALVTADGEERGTRPVSEGSPAVTTGQTTPALAEDLPKVEATKTVPADEVEKTEEPQESSPPPQESPRDWADLSMLEKLDSLHLLTEWQFQNTHRLRQLMKDDDEHAQWRIEPIGYDSKTNAYWLIGPDRLWIQRAPPKPPRSHKKRKRAASLVPPQDVKTDAEEDTVKSSQAARATRGKKQNKAKEATPTVQPSKTVGTSSSRRRGQSTPAAVPEIKNQRAAKKQANLKLDEQARALAEFQRQTALDRAEKRGRTTRSVAAPPARSTGTRVSARLRGSTQQDEWQEVPQEWLDEPVGSSKRNTRSKAKAKEEAASKADSVSDLTELSDEEAADKAPRTSKKAGLSKGKGKGKMPAQAPGEKPSMRDTEPPLPPDLVEWETICVTLEDWEHITERFEKATHYLERNLYKVLSKEIVPVVTEQLREIVKQRRIEEALNNRKRSSRLAIKESAKEEAEKEAKKKVEEEEKLSRAKRLEARQKKEEEERLKRELAREQRRKEREERELRAQQRKEAEEARAKAAADKPSSSNSRSQSGSAQRQRSRAQGAGGSSNGLRTPAGTEDWEVDCEICFKRGINLDVDVDMVTCGSCGKWQHMHCHDQNDERHGRPKRNWDVEDFICRKCRAVEGARLNGYAPVREQPAYGAYGQDRSSGSAWSGEGYRAIAPATQHPSVQRSSGYGLVQPVFSRDPRQQQVGLVNGNHRLSSASPVPGPGLIPSQSQMPLTIHQYDPEGRRFSHNRTPSHPGYPYNMSYGAPSTGSFPVNHGMQPQPSLGAYRAPAASPGTDYSTYTGVNPSYGVPVQTPNPGLEQNGLGHSQWPTSDSHSVRGLEQRTNHYNPYLQQYQPTDHPTPSYRM